jgi:DNA polymerase (family 10)
MTNADIATTLHNIASAYEILGENRFKIIAYDRAADSVDHLTSEVKDLWDDKKLDTIPGVGPSIAEHLDELFRTGHAKYWEEILGRVPASVFPLLRIPGLGPKKAYKLVQVLHLDNPKTVVADLTKAAKAGKIAVIEGFGEKSEQVILSSIDTYKKGEIKENRMPLPMADAIAQEVLTHLRKIPETKVADVLGSLRRQVATIGDIDIAVATDKPEKVLEHFLTYPYQKLVEKGPSGATLLLHNGRQVDLRVQHPSAYGAMLQYFTGSKHHNIKLRELALSKGLSLNEYGIKTVKSGSVKKYATEELFYKAVGLPYVPPELREDRGEIEAAKKHALPKLVETTDIKGDLHMHTSYQFETSHDVGKNSLADHLERGLALGYEYIGISDHNPSLSGHSEKDIVAIMKRRKEAYETMFAKWKHPKKSQIHYFLMCEVDILPQGNLALPDGAFEYVDAVVVSIHSAFTQPREVVTKRILKALATNPKVKIFGHPTGRLLGSREGVDADWDRVFDLVLKNDIAMEINSYPDRLDLPDSLAFDARRLGVKFTIDTDAHALEHMDLMRYGVSVARRAWCTAHDIHNTSSYNEFNTWLTHKPR